MCVKWWQVIDVTMALSCIVLRREPRRARLYVLFTHRVALTAVRRAVILTFLAAKHRKQISFFIFTLILLEHFSR